MEQSEEPLEGGERGRDRRRIAVVEPRLDRLRVPVAEVVEGEVVEGGRRLGEVEARPGVLDLGSSRVDASEDPPLLEIPRLDRGRDVLGVLKYQPGDVPELDREFSTLFDRPV